MILAIDVGNSHIVIGMVENGEIRNIVRFHTDPRAPDHGLLRPRPHRL